MRSIPLFAILVVALLALVAFGAPTRPVSADPLFTCSPTCQENDGRFLSLAGAQLITLGEPDITIEFVAPIGATNLHIEIFDGDTGGHWDQGTDTLTYTLYADPDGDASGTTVIGSWSGSAMPDNSWFIINIPNHIVARAPSGYYFYTLKVEQPNPAGNSQSNFKVRATAPLALKQPLSFSFVAGMYSLADRQIIYPNYPTFSPTTYDGTWDLFFEVPKDTSYLSLWDGDFDYGSADCSTRDSDDADTSNTVLPLWAVGTAAIAEGVAVGSGTCASGGSPSGAPADDNAFPLFRRAPSITYAVTDPNGNVYLNANPSGNREWEQFLIESNPAATADHHVSGPLPAGIYQVHITGLDLSNLNAWRLDYDVVGICADGTPCMPMPKFYEIGDTVWFDSNANGVQDSSEAGLAGVLLNLLDGNGNVISTTTTDANGNYLFEVDSNTYTVQVDPSNFNSGGPLAGFVSTTGGSEQTNTIVNDNIYTYDFGYRRPPVIDGCYTFTSYGAVVNPDQTVTFSIHIQSNCTRGLSHVSISLPNGALAVSPTTVYIGPSGRSYNIEQPATNPFYSIKFETIGDGVKNGGSEIFTYTLPAGTFDPTQPIQVQAKAAQNQIGTIILYP